MATVTLTDSAALALQRLRRQAETRGVSLDQHLADMAEVGEQILSNRARTAQLLDELARGGEKLPALRPDLGRADIYQDHD